MSALPEKQARLEEIRAQVKSGELVIRPMTAAERERYGFMPPPEPDTVPCEHCGEPHDPTPTERADRPRRFCSQRCGVARSGRHDGQRAAAGTGRGFSY